MGGATSNNSTSTFIQTDFNPRSPWGERRFCQLAPPRPTIFQSTLPVGGATSLHQLHGVHLPISIHAPRGGSDGTARRRTMPSGRFQSTLPVGGATRRADGSQIAEAISIHAPRGGSDQKNYVIKGRTLISIHAPRGGSDIPFLVASSRSWHFNPRSPWGERRLRLPIFLLNPSNFNPRSPWGERPSHATLCLTPLSISIHAPRGGSDGTFPPFPSSVRYFNPRSPWGERPNPYFSSWVSSVFQSTLPVGGATFVGR